MLSALLLVPLVIANCPNDFIYEENFNSCYKYVTDATEFYLAEQECQSFESSLVSITNGFENAMISEAAKHQFGASNQFWIGANTLSHSTWSWMNGSALGFTHWAPGQPSREGGQCASVEKDNGYWSATPCWTEAPFVCAAPSTNPAVKKCHSYCDSTWTYFSETDSCYRVGHYKRFLDAENDCVENGAHLTSIHSLSENEFVNVLSATEIHVGGNQYMTWIGLKRVNNGWAWTDGSQTNFFLWEVNQPDNAGGTEGCGETTSDYLNVDHPNPYYHRWNDLNCETTMRSYVCKKAARHD